MTEDEMLRVIETAIAEERLGYHKAKRIVKEIRGNLALAEAVMGWDHRHIIQYDEDGMTIQHPMSCRPNLFMCTVFAKAHLAISGPPDGGGRFYCGLNWEGDFEQYEKVLT